MCEEFPPSSKVFPTIRTSSVRELALLQLLLLEILAVVSVYVAGKH